MAYTPITVNADNFQEAINENIRLIAEEVRKKVRVQDIRPLLTGIDVNGNKIVKLKDPTTQASAVTKAKLDEVTP